MQQGRPPDGDPWAATEQPWRSADETAATNDKTWHGQAEKSINSDHHEHLAKFKSFLVATTQASKYL